MYQAARPSTIKQAFASIAHNYDLANQINSLGLHSVWNKKLVSCVKGATHLLDLCAGTGAIGFAFLKQQATSKATLLDFCPQMLEVAKKRAEPVAARSQLICADAMHLPFENNHFDAATIAYGIRNVRYPKRCFEEVYRVLKPDSPFAILELTRPHSALLRGMHKIYTRTFLPIVGRILTKNQAAYRYLAESVQTFTSPDELAGLLQSSGFTHVTIQPLHGGIATLIQCKKD